MANEKFITLDNLSTFKFKYDEQVNEQLDNKQEQLVSGTNIKTINNESILGSGNINTKELPSYPLDASTKTYSLKLINGTLTWIEE